MLNNLTGWHFVIILAVVLLLFGAPKLPGLARSVGQSMRIFRSEVKTMKDESSADADADVDGEPEAATEPVAAKKTPTKGASKPKS